MKISIINLKKNWKSDLNAGFSIFLIAIPLSVGIAIASGAPPSAGLIAAIIGGIIGSILGGGHININGPAAGLIVIVLSSIQILGNGNPELGFKYTLAAISIAGLIQILMGIFKLARVGLAFPSSVIHGMMTAIGAIILIKQFHVFLGVSAHSKNLFGLIMEIPESIQRLNPPATIIGFSTLITLFGFQKLQGLEKFQWLKLFPAPLFAIITGVLFSKYFGINANHLGTIWNMNFLPNSNLLLHVPQSLFQSLTSPDFSQIFTFDSWRMIITITLVASLESTLSAAAIDKLDPLKRQSDLDRDLWAKGVCNFICGLIGGLPIIAEIVRSSANISSGAKSKNSNFFHGCFILAFSFFFHGFLMKFQCQHYPHF